MNANTFYCMSLMLVMLCTRADIDSFKRYTSGMGSGPASVWPKSGTMPGTGLAGPDFLGGLEDIS